MLFPVKLKEQATYAISKLQCGHDWPPIPIQHDRNVLTKCLINLKRFSPNYSENRCDLKLGR
jgi:hypothetical protein